MQIKLSHITGLFGIFSDYIPKQNWRYRYCDCPGET